MKCSHAGEGQCRGETKKRRVLDEGGNYRRDHYSFPMCEGHYRSVLRKAVKRGRKAADLLMR